MRAEALQLAADIEALAKARATQGLERDRLENERRAMLGDQERLNALIATRQAAILAGERQLEQQEVRAQALAAQARSLKDLLARLEADDSSAALVEEASRLVPPPAGTAPADPQAARLRPIVPFASLKGALPLPSAGTIVTNFRRSRRDGRPARGVTVFDSFERHRNVTG